MSIFDPEGPLMGTLAIIADLAILNLITLLCCVPVITAGAAMTAMHYVLLKIVRQEDGYITADFLRSFRQNFRQATAVWSLFLLFAALLVLDFFLTGGSDGTGRSFLIFVRYMLAGAGIFAALVFCMCFPSLRVLRIQWREPSATQPGWLYLLRPGLWSWLWSHSPFRRRPGSFPPFCLWKCCSV